MERWKCLSNAPGKGLIALLLICASGLPAQEFQLAPPQIRCASRFFSGETEATLDFSLEGARIHYTLDGAAPTRQSPVYQKALRISQTSTLRAIAVHPDFRDSDPAGIGLIRLGAFAPPAQLNCTPQPNPKYAGSGVAALFDRKTGSDAFSGPGWLGFDVQTLKLELYWPQAVRLGGLMLSGCLDVNAWIFPPRALKITGSKDGKKWSTLAEKNFDNGDLAQQAAKLFLEELRFKRHKLRYLNIEINAYGALPDWHPGKGSTAWLFLDEIILW